MKKPTKFQAIHNLVGGQLSCTGDTFIYYDGQTPPEEEEVETELARMQVEYDAQEYARTRAPLYPEIGDQLDALYHAGVFPADMAAKLKKVKDDNPKPS